MVEGAHAHTVDRTGRWHDTGRGRYNTLIEQRGPTVRSNTRCALPTKHHGGPPEQHRGLVPVGVVVLVYVVAGVLWILGSGPVADTIAEATAVPREIVELGKGVLFVTITAVVLQVAMRRRAERLVAAAARGHHDARRLAASEDRNRLKATALSGTANAVVITDRDGTIAWANETFETMSGHPLSAAVGATLHQLSSGHQDEDAHREMSEMIGAGQVWHGQVVNRRRDGELYTVDQTITPVVADSGEIQNFVVIQEDVTERVRVARELDASRMRLQSLFDHAIDAILLADDEGRYIEVNPAVCELTGYSRDELLGMRPADLAAPDQQPDDVVNQFDDFVQEGTESGPFTLLHKDGHAIETEYRAVSNIQPGVHLSVLRDVTARYRMLRALTLAEGEFRELAEKAADIVTKLRVDRDGQMRVDYVNPAATTILGYRREQLYDEPGLLLDLLHERSDDAPHLLPTPDQPTRLATVQVQGADGRLVWLEIHSTLTDPSTAPVTIQLVARDVTARSEMTRSLEQTLADQLEAAEQLRTLNAMKDTFLQSVSHELRTPLTSILGFAQLLADPRYGLSPRDTQEFHRRILDNAQRLKRLLDDLLDVDRLTRGHREPNRQSTDLTELIERTVHAVELGDHPVELDLEPITMDLDAPWIERLVINLLRNVVGHTPPATRIWIGTRTTADGVELTVDDDGPGIPEADRQRLIEPFQQGADAASSPRPGTGVGLSLVNTFAQAHGGDLTITDSPGGGTRMVISLPHTTMASRPASGEDPGSDTTALPIVGQPGVHGRQPAEETIDAEQVTNEALRQLLQAQTTDQVRGIILSVIHRLGGWTVPARLADSTALPVDLSFGIGDPLLPTAEPDGAAQASLERHLPRLIEDARRALENLSRTEQLAHDASIDPLTGLLNRRAYERVLPRLRPGDTVVLFDLDEFKTVNDTRGHDAGDQVLRSFGATLRSFTRATDHPCRIGGDEFALLLEATSSAHADRLLERFRSHWEQQQPWPVSVSVGVATVSDDPAAAVAAADRAMYGAKHSSRHDTTSQPVGTQENPS